ncbi:GNAT family N-acetyltransferase [Roseobacteraceae bacterium S113]
MTSLTLTTDRLTLRRPEPRDEAAIHAFYRSERAQYVGGNSSDTFLAWKAVALMYGHWSLRGYGLWAVAERGSDDVMGLVGPFYPTGWPETEIGWVLFDGHEGKGVAAEAARAAIADARTRLGWTDIVHYIAPENTRSIALAERLGATRDPSAVVPKPDAPCLVYRQPREVAS